MPRFEIVASASNNNYMVWQAMLFHYSCVQVQKQVPVIVVHKGEEPLLPGFQRIVDVGGIVQTAPDYRRVDGVNYPPRNTAGSLRHVETDADYIILCDPDLIFLRPLPLDEVALGSQHVSFDRLSYLDPKHVGFQPQLDAVCREAGVPPQRLREVPINGGIPHVVPIGLRKALSDEWLACIEMFPTIAPWEKSISGAASRECHVGPQKEWMATMWAVVLAVHRLKLEAVTTNWCISNYDGKAPLASFDTGLPRLLHYCYGSEGFDKHAFDSDLAASDEVWCVPPDDGSVNGAIRGQLREAGTFFRRVRPGLRT